jgi:hypothetical protein
MKAYMLILVVVSLFLTACLGGGANVCVDDGICTIDEKFRGGCADCLPDFSVPEENMFIQYDPETKYLSYSYCIQNEGGDYVGDLKVAVFLNTNFEDRYKAKTDSVYLDRSEVEGYLNVQVKEGQVLLHNFLQINSGNQKSLHCFGGGFSDVAEASYYGVQVHVNSNQVVSEKSFENNYGYVSIEGSQFAYPDYLVEYDTSANFRYQRSYGFVRPNFEQYTAFYSEYSTYASVMHDSYVPHSDWVRNYLYYSAYSDYDEFLYQNYDVESHKIRYGDQFIYTINDTRYNRVAYLWTHGDWKIVMYIPLRFAYDNSLLDAYLAKYGGEKNTSKIIDLRIGRSINLPNSLDQVELIGFNSELNNGEGAALLRFGQNDYRYLSIGETTTSSGTDVLLRNLYFPAFSVNDASVRLEFSQSDISSSEKSRGRFITLGESQSVLDRNFTLVGGNMGGANRIPSVVIEVDGFRRSVSAGSVASFADSLVHISSVHAIDIPRLDVVAKYDLNDFDDSDYILSVADFELVSSRISNDIGEPQLHLNLFENATLHDLWYAQTRTCGLSCVNFETSVVVYVVENASLGLYLDEINLGQSYLLANYPIINQYVYLIPSERYSNQIIFWEFEEDKFVYFEFTQDSANIDVLLAYAAKYPSILTAQSKNASTYVPQNDFSGWKTATIGIDSYRMSVSGTDSLRILNNVGDDIRLINMTVGNTVVLSDANTNITILAGRSTEISSNVLSSINSGEFGCSGQSVGDSFSYQLKFVYEVLKTGAIYTFDNNQMQFVGTCTQ